MIYSVHTCESWAIKIGNLWKDYTLKIQPVVMGQKITDALHFL